MKTLGLVGARGHTGRELIRLIAERDDLSLAFAVSRAMDGQPVTALAPEAPAGLLFEALSPEEVAQRQCDGVILAMPNGQAAPYVAAIEAVKPDTVIVDLSADYRFDETWVYGLPELYGEGPIKGATRISNPGCYATAGQLAVAPMRKALAGPAHLFGVSGYSGAGTTPNRRNDVEALKDNLMPYALMGHIHEREMSRHLGHEVRFSPHVAAFFRGIVLTAQMEFSEPVTADAFRSAYEDAFGAQPLIRVQDEAPEVIEGAHNPGAVLGGFALSEDGRHGVMVCALDNLLKGAAVQAMQNLCLGLALPGFKPQQN
ncbi:MAG: N-acetyl-gamma-glutamyl-phosphate reductase [Oceanicaulis sp.]|uniref:N-acetyl-gamma-glutamyl-phosphate reductase n=1 Tax=Oceanicaulis sp. UBA2681 TaxID=1947007 RepID=UPI000C0BA098|nr:N-acetyl-gamma-glutamyl-phosphate reductase [Oceanicaulis sp. UBA2681]MAP48958.1 N-acetyl-gamma-glutamyl-phosphate reductase [Oceanicaulis sp.]|tara:strand:+ start:923 stop:1867 length:945 start_codon:yes stop_codon:yes gene_type:complete